MPPGAGCSHGSSSRARWTAAGLLNVASVGTSVSFVGSMVGPRKGREGQGKAMTEQGAGKQVARETVVLERKRLRVMEWGLVVAVVAAVAALIVPFATRALAFDEAAEAHTREQITELLGRTARLEEGQQNLENGVAELKQDVKTIEADVKDIRRTMADNTAAIARNQATLESIQRLLEARLPEPR